MLSLKSALSLPVSVELLDLRPSLLMGMELGMELGLQVFCFVFFFGGGVWLV